MVSLPRSGKILWFQVDEVKWVSLRHVLSLCHNKPAEKHYTHKLFLDVSRRHAQTMNIPFEQVAQQRQGRYFITVRGFAWLISILRTSQSSAPVQRFLAVAEQTALQLFGIPAWRSAVVESDDSGVSDTDPDIPQDAVVKEVEEDESEAFSVPSASSPLDDNMASSDSEGTRSRSRSRSSSHHTSHNEGSRSVSSENDGGAGCSNSTDNSSSNNSSSNNSSSNNSSSNNSSSNNSSSNNSSSNNSSSNSSSSNSSNSSSSGINSDSSSSNSSSSSSSSARSNWNMRGSRAPRIRLDGALSLTFPLTSQHLGDPLPTPSRFVPVCNDGDDLTEDSENTPMSPRQPEPRSQQQEQQEQKQQQSPLRSSPQPPQPQPRQLQPQRVNHEVSSSAPSFLGSQLEELAGLVPESEERIREVAISLAASASQSDMEMLSLELCEPHCQQGQPPPHPSSPHPSSPHPAPPPSLLPLPPPSLPPPSLPPPSLPPPSLPPPSSPHLPPHPSSPSPNPSLHQPSPSTNQPSTPTPALNPTATIASASSNSNVGSSCANVSPSNRDNTAVSSSGTSNSNCSGGRGRSMSCAPLPSPSGRSGLGLTDHFGQTSIPEHLSAFYSLATPPVRGAKNLLRRAAEITNAIPQCGPSSPASAVSPLMSSPSSASSLASTSTSLPGQIRYPMTPTAPAVGASTTASTTATTTTAATTITAAFAATLAATAVVATVARITAVPKPSPSTPLIAVASFTATASTATTAVTTTPTCSRLRPTIHCISDSDHEEKVGDAEPVEPAKGRRRRREQTEDSPHEEHGSEPRPQKASSQSSGRSTQKSGASYRRRRRRSLTRRSPHSFWFGRSCSRSPSGSQRCRRCVEGAIERRTAAEQWTRQYVTTTTNSTSHPEIPRAASNLCVPDAMPCPNFSSLPTHALPPAAPSPTANVAPLSNANVLPCTPTPVDAPSLAANVTPSDSHTALSPATFLSPASVLSPSTDTLSPPTIRDPLQSPRGSLQASPLATPLQGWQATPLPTRLTREGTVDPLNESTTSEFSIPSFQGSPLFSPRSHVSQTPSPAAVALLSTGSAADSPASLSFPVIHSSSSSSTRPPSTEESSISDSILAPDINEDSSATLAPLMAQQDASDPPRAPLWEATSSRAHSRPSPNASSSHGPRGRFSNNQRGIQRGRRRNFDKNRAAEAAQQTLQSKREKIRQRQTRELQSPSTSSSSTSSKSPMVLEELTVARSQKWLLDIALDFSEGRKSLEGALHALEEFSRAHGQKSPPHRPFQPPTTYGNWSSSESSSLSANGEVRRRSIGGRSEDGKTAPTMDANC